MSLQVRGIFFDPSDYRLNKKSLTEADIRTKFITPAIEAAGWDKVTQMREEYFFGS